ncbi:unnamed protein product [Rhizophagus irregularis]|uniref:MATA-HMG n=1 Tax=Rhizophagus irregularis TaxID=588596 RepID=A0A1B1ETW8_9GLOM|nr:MATA-HMG [Rhizophagus irregularis]CAB4435905.1 unnamed protein product [Rhizophagus irregularis]
MQKFQSYWQKCGEMKQRKKNYIGKKIADRKKMEHVQAHPGYVYRLKKPRKTTPSKQPISTLENTCVPELVTSIVNPSTID